ncbi:MAG TPA: FMN-binding negative transcriptional regulator [Hanamia sp.]|nr:FMN-binding negative transcriptional regulator [Hanamia sp.]
MYKLSHFTETDEERVFEFMQKTTFSLITGIYKDCPVATHVPLDVKRKNGKVILTGHIMKGTDHHKAFAENEKVLVIFSGPHCYVSASWYAKKNVASTWNYMDVHAIGIIRLTGEEETKKIIEDLTNKYEGPESEAAFSKLPEEYVNRLVKAIAGFHIEVESVENVFKLSQNHDEVTRKQIIENLRKTGDYFAAEIAREMEVQMNNKK